MVTNSKKTAEEPGAEEKESPAIDLDAFFTASSNPPAGGEDVRAGLIAIVGRPNVGKSTLLNCFIGQKISIVSRKAQTTRHRVTGILTQPDTQYVFVDTPGFQTQFANALNRTMNRSVTQALSDVDVVLFVVEAGYFSSKDRAILQLLPQHKPVILVVNKVDRIKDKASLMPFLAETTALHGFAAVVPISASKGKQTSEILTEIRQHLPHTRFLFSEDEITDKSERFLAAEYVREKLFRLLGEELPYATTVEIEKFETEGKLRRIFAAIVVDKSGHKPIVIGNKGLTLKRIASEARVDMEKLFGGTVYLEVWVKVKSGWANDERLLKSLGYDA